MLPRVLEPEVMDSPEEARDYDAMDHAAVNRLFVADFLAAWDGDNPLLDVGTGTAQIPIELCRTHATAVVVAIDLAAAMLQVARDNLRRAGLEQRVRLERCDAKRTPFPDGCFAAVMANSIVHHVPAPASVLAEMVRVVRPGGLLFVRDLLRPGEETQLACLVETYAGQATARQRQLFADSLRAALTLDEVRQAITRLGFPPATVQQTSDRHWTWQARRPR